jgi:hypothetical protein
MKNNLKKAAILRHRNFEYTNKTQLYVDITKTVNNCERPLTFNEGGCLLSGWVGGWALSIDSICNICQLMSIDAVVPPDSVRM